MSSTSPPLTPPHHDSDPDPVSPVRDPDIDRELTPVEGVRERADGETSPPLVQTGWNGDKESEKEKAGKKDQDLDKDIDAMFEYNANGFGDASVSIGSIPVDSADSTLKDISIKSSSFVDKGELGLNGNATNNGLERQDMKIQDAERWEGSEKSFNSISTTNSSIIAEAVVNRAINNAVRITQGGAEMKTDTADVKVGLFQYQGGDADVSVEKSDGKVKHDDEQVGIEPGDTKVGLFQYFDGDEEEIKQDLDNYQDNGQDLSGLDIDQDDMDEKLESLNLSDQENILHLYGLGGSEVTEVRLMATPPSSPRTDEEKKEFFIDVQREIYEPQKRMFSVQDKSSTESTPRDPVTDGAEKDEIEVDNEFKDDTAFADDTQEQIQSRISPEPEKAKAEEEDVSVIEDTIESDTEPRRDEGWTKEPQPVSIEVAPPLIHYESVKENGKFRIIKMPVEGNGSAVGTIRVGTGSTPSQSPHESPRENEVKVTEPVSREVEKIGQKSEEVKVTGQPKFEDTEIKIVDRKPKVEERDFSISVNDAKAKATVDIVEDQLEQPLQSISQTLPIVTPSSSTEVESNEKTWHPSIEQVIKSYSDSKGGDGTSRDIYRPSAKELGMSRSDIVSGSPSRRSRPQEESRSQRLVAESQFSPGRGDVDARIKYSTTDTYGREHRRTGPVPYDMESHSSSRDSSGRDYSYSGSDLGRFSAPYQAELIQSAYNRVTNKTGEPVPRVTTSNIDTGPIPGYKTLQEQQARWASMFKSLEDQHKQELLSQYERHQHNIHRLQQQMESELQKQHQTIRKKLDIHKEALRHMSPERDKVSPDRGQKSSDAHERSPGQEQRSPVGQQRSPRSQVREDISSAKEQRSPVSTRISPESEKVTHVRGQDRMTPVRSQMSPDRSRERRSRSAEGSLERPRSKPWREIYKEVRAEEEKREPTPPPPVKRSLEDDFTDLDSTLTRSRSSLGRSALSPRTRVSPNRDRVIQGRDRISPDRERISPGRDKVSPRADGYRERGWGQETPERHGSEVERASRSRSKRSPQSLVPQLPLSTEDLDRESPLRPSAISPHVQELLDNLNEGRSSLRGLQSPPRQDDVRHVEGGSRDLPRAGVYSSPMPLLAGKVSKSTQSSKTRPDASTSLDASRSQSYHDRSLDDSRVTRDVTLDRSLNDSRLSRDRTSDRSLNDSRLSTERSIDRRLDDSCLSSSARMNLREKHSKHLADLRSYYEEELRELRRALTESLLDNSGAGVDRDGHATIENHLLEAENRHLLDKCRTMEDELEDLYQRIREMEQKGKGLEKRASEYAAAFADSQSMGVQNRAHIEELQRYCRERDDLVNDLEAKVRSQEDAMKIYKKHLEEELELHRQDKSALQRVLQSALREPAAETSSCVDDEVAEDDNVVDMDIPASKPVETTVPLKPKTRDASFQIRINKKPKTFTRRYQIQPKTRSYHAQVKPLTRTIGTQYEEQEVEDNPVADNAEDTDDELCTVEDNKNADGDYVPDDDSGSDSDIDDEMDSVETNEILTAGEPDKERQFLVSESSLLQLLNKCKVCGQDACVTIKRFVGTMIIVDVQCSQGHDYTWRSQSMHNSMPWGNLLLSAAILFSGGSPAKILTMFGHVKVPVFSTRTYSNIQYAYLVPTVLRTWDVHQADRITDLQGRSLCLGGDGRCDSPGHTAKFGSYTLMNLEDNKVVHIELVQICDKYEAMEREQKLLHETLNTAENSLYDTRTEVVELTRKISKLELENKRLGRENDNLRHKVTQSINLTSLHESFGSPAASPRQPDTPTRRPTSSPPPYTSQSSDLRVPNFMSTPEPRPKSADVRVPSFTGAPEPRPKSVGGRDSAGVGKESAKKSKPSDWKDKKQKDSGSENRDTKRSAKLAREDLNNRSRQQESSLERPVRDITPPRRSSFASQDESETGDSASPMIKAERELYKLRDMMRQAVAVRPASSPPPEPVLQKKFYGSERPTSKDEYVPDFGTPRGRKEKQPSNQSSVAKSKSSSTHTRQDRSEKDKSSKKSTTSSSKSDKGSKFKEKGKERSKDIDTRQRTPTKKDHEKSGVAVKPDEFNTSTRFDISIDEEGKKLNVKKIVSQSGKQKNLFAESNQSTGDRSHDQSLQRSHDEGTQTSEQDMNMQQTLDSIRAGNYTTRPQWEDVFTSLAKPKPEDESKVKSMTREEKIKDRLRNISDMEHRYDELQMEKRQLESSLTKIPIHGRVDRNSRRQKEELEERLDVVEKELGSLRMSLKRCNVLKTAG